MARVVGGVAVTVGADVSALRKGMDKAGRSVKGFGRDSDAMGKKFAKVGAGIAIAAVAASVAVFKMAGAIGKVGAEISNLSKIAGIGTTEFQRLAAGAQTVGIEQDKLADILKDVNDKIGDFMVTGAGPMADFFENIAPLVGVTADSFRDLSGPDALQLYVSSLEKAGVSQAEMTFFMEALASDATALIPLLRDNGTEMKRLGDRAESTGRVLSEKTVAGADELNDKLIEMRDTTKKKVITALLSLEDELILLAGFVNDYGVPALKALIEFAADAATGFTALTESIKKLGGSPRFFDKYGNELDGPFGDIIASPNMTLGTPLVDDGNLLPPNPLKIGITPIKPIKPIKPVKPGSGSGRDFEAEMQTLQEQFATEFEIIEGEFAKQLAQLDEFRAAKAGTEEEYNELEARIRKDHADKMAALDKNSMAAKLQMASGMFGDLATIFGNSNKKLFKIGQAAAIASATIDGLEAAVSAFKHGMAIGGPALAYTYQAASLLKTGALISKIASQSGGGGGSAPSGGGGGGGGGAPAPNTSPNVAIQLHGDFFARPQINNLINLINEALEDGAVIRLV